MEESTVDWQVSTCISGIEKLPFKYNFGVFKGSRGYSREG